MARDRAKIVISSSRMGGTDPLTPSDMRRLVVENYQQGPRRLIDDYQDQPVLMVGLEFTVDNTAVESANTVLAGKLEQVIIDANKIWPFKRQLNLCLKPSDLRLFEFRGTMVSEYLDHQDIRYEFVQRDREKPMTETDIVDQGFSGFTLRAFTHPITSIKAKMQMLIYPLDRDTLFAQHPLARTPCFPGIEVYRSELHLGVQRDELLDTSFGLNILPCIKAATPITDQGPVPTREDMVGSMCGLLRKTFAPEVRTKRSTLLQRWGDLKEHGADKLEPREYREEWPDMCPKRAPASQGRIF